MKKNFISKSAIVLATVTLMSVVAPSISADTTSDLNQVNTELAAAKQKMSAAETKISSNTKLQATKTKKIADLKDKIAQRNDQLAKQARSAQINNSGSVLKFVADSNNFSDAVSRTVTVATVVHANNQAMEQQKADKAAIETEQSALKTSIKKQETLRIQLMQASANLDAKRADLNAQKNREDEAAQKAAKAAEAAAKAAEQAKTVEAAEKAADTAKTSVAETTPAPAVQSQSVDLAASPANNASQPAQASQPASHNNNTRRPAASQPAYSPAPAASYGSVTSYALSFVNKTPYKYGGTTPAGFDCSGFVQYVFGKFGKSMPRVTSAQESAGTPIPLGQAQAGDLYFWGGRGGSYHVAIALGGGRYVHAPAPGQKVSTGSVSGYRPQFAIRVR
ncbi:hypothetical protein LPAF129_03340 [Ligilactobacillus pabuli]|uniref:NlpC/P60 domain-containing protein n=1 Tax=Ligilactobacillus pabuli TaxID=2886039 RepID=A0ABQ5JF17_9LACO|nr:C40 family peptidase [Ligilactobacillus pabuli]GKS80649.1 hypothetical protein LPAF129_03340 [Ligilactobacillus pabuli]